MAVKKRFSQAQFDRLVTRKAKAILAYRKARLAKDNATRRLNEYNKTHR